MICIRLEGGLGNQLFQYAAGRSLAIRHKTNLVLDTSILKKTRKGITFRAMELNNFKIIAEIADAKSIKFSQLFRYAPGVTSFFTNWRPFIENSLNFNSNFANLPDSTYLVGYWQSFRYFENIASLIYAELMPNKPMSEISSALKNKMTKVNSVALHVRRGDYVTLKSANSMHGALSVSYYKMAIDDIQAKLVNPVFFVFSDDPAWCKEHLPLPLDSTKFITHNSGPDSWQDLILMSNCNHSVIANSSFSWWAAWLADQKYGLENRLVYAPSRWFVGSTHDTKDRFPSHWIAK